MAVGGLLLAAAATEASASPRNQIQVFMINTGADPDARGRILFVENRAQQIYMIKISDMDPNVSTYDVVLDGVVQETISLNAEGVGRIRHRARLKGPSPGTLPHDPRGGTLEIAAMGTVYLTADVPTTPAESHQLMELRLDLTPAAGVTGSAEAEFRSRFGRMKFEVELDGVAPGLYDVMVDGVDMGDIEVAATGQGEIEFDSRPSTDDGAGDDLEVLLTFDPRGRNIEIQQGGVVLFSGIFPLQ